MSSRRYKNFPPGTFIPTSQRLMAICQLCIAFSLMLWYLVQPFMGEYFSLRSRMLLYEYVMGSPELLKIKKDDSKTLERQAKRFKQLPEEERQLVIKDYQRLQNYGNRSIIQKIHDGIQTFIRDIPPFEQAWIFFSITIAILILLKVEGAKHAAWILPLIVLAYSIDNQFTGKSFAISPDIQLFPTEEKIVQEYLNEPLSPSFLDQKTQLEKGWHLYLISNWSTTQHASEESALEEAEFQFTLARLKRLHTQPQSEWLNHFHEKQNPLLLFFFIGWNILFASLMIDKSTRGF